LEGCLGWQREGQLNPPEEVLLATKGYKDEMDIVGRFMDECCLVSPEYVVPAKEVYNAFKAWSQEQGEKWVMSQQAFGMKLTEKGHESKRGGSSGAYRYPGIGLKTGN
jgi:putative DNA primase/helicase